MHSSNELKTVLPNASEEIFDIIRAIVEIGRQHNEEAKIAPLLKILPSKLGLDSNNTIWTSADVEEALTRFKNAYKLLLQVPNKLRNVVTIQIGQEFGLTELSNNEQHIFEAIKKWRKERVGAILSTHVTQTTDSFTLIKLLDDTPTYNNFEQIFLNTLPIKWGLPIFEEWQSISMSQIYIDKLHRTIVNIENKADSLPQAKTTLLPAQGASISSKEQDINGKSSMSPLKTQLDIPNRALNSPNTISTRAPQPFLQGNKNSDAEQKQTRASDHPLLSSEVDQKRTVDDNRIVPHFSPSVNTSTSTDIAFASIKNIFNSLSLREQHLLWKKLVEEYDPQ
ncbi:hypothetical protein KDW_39210 [Dictyobacter vulcani]|uniref:Uncharacterized protein n=1 Tax=Dictyobacter vulcani TaxID=2607529 RepID=A0A5J4KUK8_9CHLR|nr:hypothetical protein [Dictyobacter vulcani]GER89759.1 hypothetical protein KDW_39210 [Dictyobacter vulcani]